MLGCYVVYALSVIGTLAALGLAALVDTPEKLLRTLVLAVVMVGLGLGALIIARTEREQ